MCLHLFIYYLNMSVNYLFIVCLFEYIDSIINVFSGAGIAVNSISVCAEFCVTGSEDGFMRLWPLDFSSVFLEAGRYSPVNHSHNQLPCL